MKIFSAKHNNITNFLVVCSKSSIHLQRQKNTTMKQKTLLLICLAIGCLLVSCSTRPLATSNYYGDYTEEEWQKMVEKSRAEAKAYL